MLKLLRPCAVALLLTSGSALAAADSGPLTLAEIERRAFEHDVSVRALASQSRALREQAVADGQLPDPSVSLGVMSLPVDTFSRTAEPMTQTTVGVTQSFPAGASLRYQAERTAQLADAGDAQAQARRLLLLQEARTAYLELHYQTGARALIADSQRVFDELVEVTKAQYRNGRANLQDVLSAQLERALLDDRARSVEADYALARAGLERWAGPLAAEVALPADLPELNDPPGLAQLREALNSHPLLQASNARVAAGQSAVQAAREQYKPGWMLNLTYGERGGREPNGEPRSDMLSAMVTFELPIFTGKRQDKRVAASIEETNALRFERDDTYYELQRSLDAEYPRWQQLRNREQGYVEAILPAARHNSAAALSAYRNSVTDFTALMRAYLSELDNRLQDLRTRVDRRQAQARLLYLAGEQS